MEEKYIIDTIILIYFLDGKIPDKQLSKIEKLFIESFNIYTITKIELLGWQRIDSEIKNKIEDFVKNANVHYIDVNIEKKAIELKQKHKIAIPDAIIAATDLINNFILVTRNETDFYKIRNLKIYNPFNL